MKTNRFILCAMLILALLSVSVFADPRIETTSVTLSPASLTFADKNAVQVTAQFAVYNTNDVPIANVELKGSVTSTGLSTIADAPTQTFSLGAMGRLTKTLTFNFPRTSKPGDYTFSFSIKDTASATLQRFSPPAYTVNRAPLLEVQQDGSAVEDITVKGEPGDENILLTYTLNNLGNVDLTNVKLAAVFSSLKDEDDDKITLSLTPALVPSLLIDSSATFTVKTTIPSGFDIETLSGNLEISADQDLTADTSTTKQTLPMSIDVRPLSCKASSSSSNVKISIEEPNNDQEYEFGEVVKARIDVTNKANSDKRIRVQASLIDTNDNNVVESDTQEKRIKENDEESFFYEFTLTDESLDEDTDLTLYVKAFEKGKEDLVCSEDEQNLNFVVPAHKLAIEDLNVNPLSLTVGGTVYVTATVKNVGANKERATLKVENTELGVSQTTQTFELSQDRDDDDNIYNVNLRFNIPQDAKPGQYTLDVTARSSGKSTTEQVTLVITGTSTSSTDTSDTDTGSTDTGDSAGQISVGTGTQGTSYTGAVTTDKSFWDNLNSGTKIPTSVWVLIDIVLVLGVISLLVFLFRRH